MGYLGAGTRDYLNANAAWRRMLLLDVRTPELLRKPNNRLQTLRQEQLLEEARSQLRSAMREKRRRAFRGEVSVELVIIAADDAVVPSAPKSVKRYLDALQGIAYADDRQVAHLLVRRFAGDHPYSQRATETSACTTTKQRAAPAVHIVLTPLRIYVADYDRAFSTRPGGFSFAEDAREEEAHGDTQRELERLYREREDDDHDAGIYSFANTELLHKMRRYREAEIRRLEGGLILRQQPERFDRPGPDPDAHYARLGLAGVVGATTLLRKYELPGTIWLPPLLTETRRPGQPSWPERVRGTLAAHRARWGRILPDFFDMPLALDISIFGAQTTTHDIDNVAHTVLQAFEELYCRGRRGTVVAYRVYRQASDQTGIRLHLMTDDKLRQLESAIDEARSHVISTGPQ